jgi:ribosomal protein S27E
MSSTIIGFGKQTRKDFGAVAKVTCPRCSNELFYHLIHTRIWFTYFFIPVLPYRSQYNLECPVCSHEIAVYAAEIEAAKQGTLTIHT